MTRCRHSKSELLLLLGLLLLGLIIRFRIADDWLELAAEADSLEFAHSADRLSRGLPYALDLDGISYPPGKPPGYSIWLSLFIRLTGDVAKGLRLGTWLPATLGLIACWAWARLVFGPRVALWAALVFTLSPLHVAYSSHVVNDGLMCSAGALLLYLAQRPSGRATRWPWVLWGLLLGLACCFRFTVGLLFFPVLLAMLSETVPTKRKLAAILMAGIGLALPLLLLFGWQWKIYGSPWLTGNAFWVPDRLLASTHPLALSHAFGTGDAVEGNLLYYVRSLLFGWSGASMLGTGCWVFIVLGTAALLRCALLRRAATIRFSILVLGPVPIVLFFFSCYRFACPRFLLPMLPSMAILAALGAASAFECLPRPLRMGPGAMPCLVGMTVLLAMAASGEYVPVYQGRVLSLLNGDYSGFGTNRMKARLDSIEGVLPPNALLLSDQEPFRLELSRLLRGERQHCPIGGGSAYLDRILLFELPPLHEGRPAPYRPPRQLTTKGVLDRRVFAWITNEIHEGRPTFLLASGRSPLAEETVHASFRTKRVAVNDSWILYEVRLR